MNGSKILGVILIIIALAFGYIGIGTVSDNTKSVEVVGIELEASNESGKQQGYMYIGLAVLLFACGVYIMNRSRLV